MRAARWLLAGFMVFAGITHLVSAEAFLGQVPTWLPFRTPIVWVSGVSRSGWASRSRSRGRVAATSRMGARVLPLLVFPGNLYQAIAGTDAFGLDTPYERWGRLVLQPVLILWALWSSGAWPRRDPSA